MTKPRAIATTARDVIGALNSWNQKDAMDAAKILSVPGLPKEAETLAERLFERNMTEFYCGVALENGNVAGAMVLVENEGRRANEEKQP